MSWPGGLNSRPFPSLVSPSQITKGKLHGSIDVRLSVMSINKKAQRIDLDTEDNIYHLKVTSVGGRGVACPLAEALGHAGERGRGRGAV